MAADVVYVVNTGLEIVTDRLLTTPNADEPRWIEFGVGTTPATVTDTDIETATGEGEARTACTQSQQTTNTTDDTYQIVGTITKLTSSDTITELCVFNHLTAGTCFLRATFDGIALNAGDSIQFTVKVVFDQA